MYRENFPRLNNDNLQITSPATFDYNCIAWSFGETKIWWSPLPGGYYWPRGIPRNMRLVANIVALYLSQGFEVCATSANEAEFEKVALYTGSDGNFCHVALQHPDGKWTSKLGQHEDIVHESAEALLGGEFEAIACVLRRPRDKSIES